MKNFERYEYTPSVWIDTESKLIHIASYAQETKMLVFRILEKIKHKRTKGVEPKIEKVVEAWKDKLDYYERFGVINELFNI